MVLTGLLSACSAAGTQGPADSGPLSVAEGSGEWCLPDFETAGEVMHGSEVLSNESGSVLQITDVSLVDARNLVAQGAYQAPLEGMPMGTLLGWPSAERLQERGFEPGARVAPHSQLNLVVLLRSGRDPGSADVSGVRIDYEVEGETFSVTTPHSVTWRERC